MINLIDQQDLKNNLSKEIIETVEKLFNNKINDSLCNNLKYSIKSLFSKYIRLGLVCSEKESDIYVIRDFSNPQEPLVLDKDALDNWLVLNSNRNNYKVY